MPAKAAARTMRGISDGTPAKPLTRQVNSMSVTPLSPEQLYTRCDVTRFTFETTEELRDLDQVIGQERALERSDVNTSELLSLMLTSYAVFCLKTKKENYNKSYR